MGFPIVVLDCFRNSIEVPLLSSSIVSPSSEDNVVSSNTFSNSLHWKTGSNVEWSIDMEAKLFIESFSPFLRSIVDIDNLPPLLNGVVLVLN